MHQHSRSQCASMGLHYLALSVASASQTWRHGARLAGLAASLVVASALSLPGVVRAAPTAPLGPNACHIGAPPIQGTDVCFSPARVQAAENRMPVRVVRPRQLVWRATGLRLHHVMLFMSSAWAIEYLYGRMPLSGNPAVPVLTLDRPKYVLVYENTTLFTRSHPKPFLEQTYFVAYRNLACRHLSLTITTNTSSSTAARVEKVLSDQAGC